MLVISPNLILSTIAEPGLVAEASLPPGTPRILWDNEAVFGTVTADSEADGYPVTNLSNPSTNTYWTALVAGQVVLTFTPQGSDFIDAVGIARHNFGSAGIAVEIGYFTAGGTIWNVLISPITPPNDEPLLFHFTAQAFTELVIVLHAGSAPAFAAVLYIGKMLIMERGVDVGADYAVPRFSRNTEFYNGRSERGDFVGRIVTSQWIQGVTHNYRHLTPTWYRAKLDPFIRAAQQNVPFFYAFTPVDYPAEVAYAWLAEDPIGMTSPATRRVAVVLQMDGILE